MMQQMLQVATQPSPVKAVFVHDDIELAAVVLVQHLIASSSHDVDRPVNFACQPQAVVRDEVEPPQSCHSNAPPQPAPPPSSLSAAAASVTDSAAVAKDVSKQAAVGRVQRRHRTFAVRPPLPPVSQLMEMGFARRKAEAAVKHLGLPLLLYIYVLEYLVV